jgi:hypothetical protein
MVPTAAYTQLGIFIFLETNERVVGSCSASFGQEIVQQDVKVRTTVSNRYSRQELSLEG